MCYVEDFLDFAEYTDDIKSFKIQLGSRFKVKNLERKKTFEASN